MRMRRWDTPDEPLPERPFRNTAIFHAALAGIIVLVAWLTNGPVDNAIVVAVLFFVVATGWSFWRWSKRLEEEQRRSAERERRGAGR
jgi:membrane protein implicated in regulation of membrane protease activity